MTKEGVCLQALVTLLKIGQQKLFWKKGRREAISAGGKGNKWFERKISSYRTAFWGLLAHIAPFLGSFSIFSCVRVKDGWPPRGFVDHFLAKLKKKTILDLLNLSRVVQRWILIIVWTFLLQTQTGLCLLSTYLILLPIWSALTDLLSNFMYQELFGSTDLHFFNETRSQLQLQAFQVELKKEEGICVVCPPRNSWVSDFTYYLK